jgi:hypothetical protein
MSAKVRIGVVTVLGLLMCGVPSASTQTGQPCTGATSSIALDQPAVTIWYPPNCVHP